MKASRLAIQLWPWLAAVISGLLYAACFEPINQSWLCWICLTPLLGAVWFSGGTSKRAWLRHLALGYVAGLTFFTCAFSWLGSLGALYQNLFLHGLSFVLSLYLALYLAFWTVFCGLVRPVEQPPTPEGGSAEAENKWSLMLRSAGGEPTAPKTPVSPWVQSWRNLLLAFVIASAWTSAEWVRGWLFSGFGWNGLGVALHQNWVLIQAAEYGGVLGLTFVVAFANVIALTTVRRLIIEARTRVMRPHWDLNFTMLGIVALILLGWHLAKLPRTTFPVRVAAVQPDIAQTEKFSAESGDRILETLGRLSELTLSQDPPPDLLVWPESALPGPVLADATSHDFVLSIAARTKADILMGSDVIEPGRAYNGAFLFTEGGQSYQAYRKIHLVPFGEYIPARHPFPLFAAIARRWIPGDFAAGEAHTVFSLTKEHVRVAPLICFEDTVGELTRHFILPEGGGAGANLLVNVTNDGWFLHSAGSHQHLANAIFRCIETRRPMVRAANTGVTCFVNQLGRVTHVLQDDKGSTFGEGVLCDTIDLPANPELTFYVRHGDFLGPITAVITGLTILAAFAAQRLRRREPAANL